MFSSTSPTSWSARARTLKCAHCDLAIRFNPYPLALPASVTLHVGLILLIIAFLFCLGLFLSSGKKTVGERHEAESYFSAPCHSVTANPSLWQLLARLQYELVYIEKTTAAPTIIMITLMPFVMVTRCLYIPFTDWRAYVNLWRTKMSTKQRVIFKARSVRFPAPIHENVACWKELEANERCQVSWQRKTIPSH